MPTSAVSHAAAPVASLAAAVGSTEVLQAGLFESVAFSLVVASLAEAIRVHAIPFCVTFLKGLRKGSK